MKYNSGSGELGFPDNFRFGIELEAFNVNTSRNITNFRRNMSERFKGVFTGHIDREHKSLYHSRESRKFLKEHRWKMANALQESLVSHGGAEIVSPILYDKKEDWQNIEEVCLHMQKYPGKHGDRVVADEKCGAHVHFDARALEHKNEDGQRNTQISEKMMGNFLRLWMESEELVYKMCNGENDPLRAGAINNKITGLNRLVYSESIAKVKGMAAPTGKKIMKQIENGTLKLSHKKWGILKRIGEKIQGKSIKRYVGLNLTNLGNQKKNTIEFRISNGSLDPEVIKQNVFLYGSLLSTAREITLDPEQYKEKLDEFYKTDVSEEDKVNAFTNLVFNNDKDREIYIKRWSSVKDAEVFKNNHKKDFAQGRFNRENFAQIAQRTPAQKIQNALKNIEKVLREKLSIEKPDQVQEEGGR